MTSSNEGCLVASDGSLAAAMKAPWRLLGSDGSDEGSLAATWRRETLENRPRALIP